MAVLSLYECTVYNYTAAVWQYVCVLAQIVSLLQLCDCNVIFYYLYDCTITSWLHYSCMTHCSCMVVLAIIV